MGSGRYLATSPMRRYVARNLVQLVVAVIGISVLAFGILHVLGDPVLLLLPQNAGKEEFERYRHLFGLDRPIYVQYWKFVSRAVLGDFGKSWYADTPAFNLVLERMPPTIYLTLSGLVVALLIALPLGTRSEEHTSELQSRPHLVCRLLLEKKKKAGNIGTIIERRYIVRSRGW